MEKKEQLQPWQVDMTLSVLIKRLESSVQDGVYYQGVDAQCAASIEYFSQMKDVKKHREAYENIMGEDHLTRKMSNDPGFALRMKHFYKRLEGQYIESEKEISDDSKDQGYSMLEDGLNGRR